MARLFGTDGVRGVANTELSCEMAINLGRATAHVLAKGGRKAKILIGKDTRVSSDMLESALAAGACSVGADVVLLGFVPTPAVALLVKKYGADAGVVISASHNPVEFNGIKIFNKDGFKLADEIEDEIESFATEKKGEVTLRTGGEVGSVSFSSSAAEDYVDYLVGCVDGDLSGVKVAVDCANGAAYQTAQMVLRRLGAEAVFVGVEPDGRNINDGVGTLYLDSLRDLVKKSKADIGIAFDGDADRCLAVDENGEEIDGDMIIGIFAKFLREKKKLKKDTAVVTIMTNLGFMDFCKKNGIKAVRTAVGDRYVLAEMLKSGYSLGGEQSGHILLLDYSTTGDGQLTALLLLSILKAGGAAASSLAADIARYPQIMLSVAADAGQKAKFKNDEVLADFISEKEADLFENGRVVVRVSGTEPIIRVMVEGKDEKEIAKVANEIKDKIAERI